MLSFQKKCGTVRNNKLSTSNFHAARGACDTYTMNLKIYFKVRIWIIVINTVNMEDF